MLGFHLKHFLFNDGENEEKKIEEEKKHKNKWKHFEYP